MSRIPAFEGLRGYLALWVFIGHAYLVSGYGDSYANPWLWVMTRPVTAVSVFIILSGFVIAWLLLNKRESYGRFITRRFFRLYPVYVVVLLASLLLLEQKLETIMALPLGYPGRASAIEMVQNALAAPWEHFLVHLTMLHGLYNNEYTHTLLGQAWSLSLEWQFYLVAPLLIAALAGRYSLLALAAGLALTTSLKFATQDIPIFQSAHYFWIGIISCLIYRHEKLRPLAAAFAWPAVAATAALLMFRPMEATLALFIWALVFAVTLRGSPASFLFTNRLALYFGRISYSLYLCHMLALIFALKIWLPHLQGPLDPADLVTVVLPTAAPLAIGMSALLYRLVELPGINTGHWLTRTKPLAESPQADKA